MCPFPVDSDPVRPCVGCRATEGAEPYRFHKTEWSDEVTHVICECCASLSRADGYTITLIDQRDGPTEDGDPCAHCQHPIWYCNSEEQWFHVDPDKVCFLANGKAAAPCQDCGEYVAGSDHCGEDLPDGTSQYLCPDCYRVRCRRTSE